MTIQQKLKQGIRLTREDILTCMRKLHHKQIELRMYNWIMEQNLRNIEAKKRPTLTDDQLNKMLDDNKDWI